MKKSPRSTWGNRRQNDDFGSGSVVRVVVNLLVEILEGLLAAFLRDTEKNGFCSLVSGLQESWSYQNRLLDLPKKCGRGVGVIRPART